LTELHAAVAQHLRVKDQLDSRPSPPHQRIANVLSSRPARIAVCDVFGSTAGTERSTG